MTLAYFLLHEDVKKYSETQSVLLYLKSKNNST